MKLICKHCGSKKIIKKGKTKTKYFVKQVYMCKNCKHKFVNTGLHNKTYPPTIVNASISNYNLGYTLNETIKLINSRFKIRLPKSTLNGWIKEFKSVTPFYKIKQFVLKDYLPDEVIASKNFTHNGLQYNFKYHLAKLEYICEANQFNSLRKYIIKIHSGTPSFFGNDKRCSKPEIYFETKKSHSNNIACSITSMAIKAKKNNFERHSLVETFFLINDANTIATEVPVWFWDKEENASYSGHIDLVQIRRGGIFIMDYKPDASKEKKATAQLAAYAKALSFRTGIPHSKFRCGWFDDKDYYEFDPNKIRKK